MQPGMTFTVGRYRTSCRIAQALFVDCTVTSSEATTVTEQCQAFFVYNAVVCRRADPERGRNPDLDRGRRVDGAQPRRLPVRPVRTHNPHHRSRRRHPHLTATPALSAPPPPAAAAQQPDVISANSTDLVQDYACRAQLHSAKGTDERVPHSSSHPRADICEERLNSLALGTLSTVQAPRFASLPALRNLGPNSPHMPKRGKTRICFWSTQPD